MKKIKFKGKKHAITACCMLVGMFVLTSAVYANYDNAKGYTNYKEALKNLAFYEENFTADGGITCLVDNKEMLDFNGNFKVDGDNVCITTKDTDSFGTEGDESQTVEISKDGKKYYYYPEKNSFYEYEGSTDYRPDMEDPTIKKSIKFAELFADTMIGDLKNNFVLTSKDKDTRTYTVKVSGSQIPEIINSGISLVFTAANSQDYSDYSTVKYEDYDKSLADLYKENTGKELTDSVYEQWGEDIEKACENLGDKYYDILDQKGNSGILYVKTDGTYEYYKTYEQYMKNVESDTIDETSLMRMLGSDPYIDNAICTFTLDKEGNLLSNYMEATMSGVDENGKKHSITMKSDLKVTDYGTTKVEAFDAKGKTKLN